MRGRLFVVCCVVLVGVAAEHSPVRWPPLEWAASQGGRGRGNLHARPDNRPATPTASAAASLEGLWPAEVLASGRSGDAMGRVSGVELGLERRQQQQGEASQTDDDDDDNNNNKTQESRQDRCKSCPSQQQAATIIGPWQPKSLGRTRRGGRGAERAKRAPTHYGDDRRALDLAVNQLRILESLDEELRKFANNNNNNNNSNTSGSLASSLPATRPDRETLFCSLPLRVWATNERKSSGCLGGGNLSSDGGEEEEAAGSCVTDCLEEGGSGLRGRVPPYMLNLHSRLTATPTQGSPTMPYNSLVARSFQQPQMAHLSPAARAVRGEMRAAHAPPPPPEPIRLNQDLVVELSATDPHRTHLRRVEKWRWTEEAPATTTNCLAKFAPNNSSHQDEPLDKPPGEQLCFWFHIGRQVRARLHNSAHNASRNRHLAASQPEEVSRQLERLVEAELHLFKLLPQRRSRPNDHNIGPDHLKTNLLEVSLYQIMPPLPGGQPAPSQATNNGLAKWLHKQPAGSLCEPPLRLLDIRRIDLFSSGWETFFVKRAVEDWLESPALNLGLVIKAKTMFDEPIPVGLIRFAQPIGGRRTAGPEAAPVPHSSSMSFSGRRHHHQHQQQAEQPDDEQVDRQPILVIYSTGLHSDTNR